MADPARRHCQAARNPQVTIAPRVSRCHMIQRGDRTKRSTSPAYDSTGTVAVMPVVREAVRTWLNPPPPPGDRIVDPAQRRLATTEVLVVLTVTLGLSAVRSGLSLLDALLAPVPLNQQQVAL